MQLIDLELSRRSINSLNKLGIETVEELVKFSAEELLEVKWFGFKSLKEIRLVLAEHRLSLKDDHIIVDAETIGMLIGLQEDMKKFLSKKIEFKIIKK